MHSLYDAIEKTLNTFNHSYQNPKPLAAAILKASDYFIKRSGASPWSDPAFCAAYIAHFLPMNVFRLRQGLIRLQQPQILQLLHHTPVYDYGCGPLTFLIAYTLTFKQWPYGYKYFDLDPRAPRLGLQILKQTLTRMATETQHDKLTASHTVYPQMTTKDLSVKADASQAQNLQQMLSHSQELPTHLTPLNQVSSDHIVTLSYSLNELPEALKLQFLKFKHLLIFEPSMRTTSRQLLEFRSIALKQGFFSLAPCFHSLACPMLTHSQKDWCFDRTSIDIPPQALNLYKHLPFDQEQATFSYLLLSQEKTTSTVTPPWARVVGDTLKEKGKTRTMICRNEHREFLAILKKQKLDLKLHRGEAMQIPESTEIKGNELRITSLPES